MSGQTTAYYHTEWDKYQTQPERQRDTLSAVAGITVSDALDIGCGAGQELLPFVSQLGATVTGVDVDPDAIQVAIKKFENLGFMGRAKFICCPAESLPMDANCFDVVTCRLALPYLKNREALQEVSRVLRPGGLLIIKVHHLYYYLGKLIKALRNLRIRSALSAVRVILAGTLFHMTGRQFDNRCLKREVFQTRWLFRRLVMDASLIIISELQDSSWTPATPTFLIEKPNNAGQATCLSDSIVALKPITKERADGSKA